jgi:hypothetical protein
MAWLQQLIARLTKANGSNYGNFNTGTQTNTNTGGGAAVEGRVETRGGHFIGRDFVQIVTNVIGEDPGEAQSVIAHYLQALAVDLAGLKLNAIDPSAAQAGKDLLQLTDIYVPLNTQLRIAGKATLTEWLTRNQRDERSDMHADRETRAVAALEALATHRELTVLGKPRERQEHFRRERPADAGAGLARAPR